MPKKILAVLLVCALGALDPDSVRSADEGAPPVPAPEAVALSPAPDPAAFTGQGVEPSRPVAVRFLSPQADSVGLGGDIDVFLQADNYALAPDGNTLHLLLDNGAPLTVADARVPVTFRNLPEGGHTLRVLAAKPDGTALANPEAYAMVHFFVRRRDFQNYVDPASPYLTVNLPLNSRGAVAALQGRVWFDFHAQNAPLAKESGYVVRYTVNQAAEVVSTPRPVYWDNLQPGRYELTAELLTSALQPVPGAFNRVTRSFEVQAPIKAMPVGTAVPAHPPAD